MTRVIGGRMAAAGLGFVSWLAGRLPDRLLSGIADLVGELWYRLAPERAGRARRNLRRVCGWLAAEGMGPARARRAATDPAVLERLVRASFRHAARYYLEVAQVPSWTPAFIRDRLAIDSPEVVDRAFATAGPIIFIAPHFGSVELPGLYLASRSGRTPVAPMETLRDPALQRYFVRTRGAMGIRIVSVREARRELLAALRAGDPVGLVADRDLTGGGIATTLFGAPAPLPAGPALLAIESGARLYATAVRRLAPGRFAGRLEEIPVPTGGTRRERVTAILADEARAFERAIADAPEQWWAIFFPIWPDLEAAAAPTAEPNPAPTAESRPDAVLERR
ncbi:MAG: hypothetical protein IVW53_03565 [Chloroflexi bacterium]|nr:hypothetical protein [Chloroflexota bacterium]